MSILNYFDENLITAISNTILHSLWQASLIALILNIVLNRIPESNGTLRYNISMVALFLCFITSCITLGISLVPESVNSTYIGSAIIQVVNPISDDTIHNLYQYLGLSLPYQDLIILIWVIGAGLFAIKLVSSYLYMKWIVSDKNLKYNPQLKSELDTVLSKLNIHKSVGIFESSYISGPLMLGILRPIILFPIGMYNQLTNEEVESILSHELAHIKRHDFLFNIIQSFIEILFYYHPAIWWIAANIRAEREFACDQLVVQHVNNPVNYAKLLVKLQEESKFYHSQLTLAFAKSNSNFTHRIKRILNMSNNRLFIREKIYALGFIGLSVVLFSFSKSAFEYDAHIKKSIEKLPTNIIGVMSSDTIPTKKIKKSEVIVKSRTSSKMNTTSSDGKHEEVEIEMDDDQITSMIVNGKVIDPKDYDKYINDMDIEVDEMEGELGSMTKTIKIELNDDEDVEDHMDSRKIIIKKGGDNSNTIVKSYRFDSIDGMDEELIEKMRELNIDIAMDNDKMAIYFDSLGREMDIMGDELDLMGHDLDMLNPSIHVFEFDTDGDHDALQWFDRNGNNFELHNDEHLPNNFGRNRSIADQLGTMLNRDGLLEIEKDNKVELTGKHLKINGDKQPKNIYSKYKREYEDIMGMELTKNSKIEFMFKGSTSKNKKMKFRSF